jgi:hypothetical protein
VSMACTAIFCFCELWMEIDTEVFIARIYLGFLIIISGRLFLSASENYHHLFTECVPVCGYLGLCGFLFLWEV